MTKVIWMTGLSGSGKSTISEYIKKHFGNVVILDGDIIRSGLCKDLGFSIEDRSKNIERIAYVAKIISQNGINVIVPAITPTNELREIAKNIVGPSFILAWVKCSLETCEDRDVKGLYAKARNGEIKNFTGIDSPFEEPNDYQIMCNTSEYDVSKCAKSIISVLNSITFV